VRNREVYKGFGLCQAKKTKRFKNNSSYLVVMTTEKRESLWQN
jgi:hypothetical protein